MNLRQKIGQLFVVGARGSDPVDEVVRHVRDNHVGGVIWFQSTTEETRRTNALLQSLAKRPLLISADLESGMGMRFTDAIWWPPAMALAATGDVSLAEEQSRITAVEARRIGVNQIFAPVADVNVDPKNPVINVRSFGESAEAVARFVSASVRGTQSGGCLATAKHFPGHGDTHVDSHRALPTLDVTRDRLDRVELVPFRAAIEAGVRSMMIGHLAVPSLDDTAAPVRAQFENTYGTHRHEVPEEATLPATLSRRIIIGLLRGELGFDGLVVTDAMDMGGLAAHFDPGEAAVRGIEAGEDQILYSADTDAAIGAVYEAVQRGRLTERRIEESIARIEAAREFVSRQETGDRAVDHGLAEEIARRSIALVRDEAGLLPLRARNIAVVVVSDLPEENPLVDAVRELGLPGVLMADATTASLDIDADVILLLLALRPKSGAGRIAVPAAVRALSERHARKTIAVSFGSPYILRELGEVSTYVCAWGIQPVLQRAAIAALRGRFEMRGRVPVSV